MRMIPGLMLVAIVGAYTVVVARHLQNRQKVQTRRSVTVGKPAKIRGAAQR